MGFLSSLSILVLSNNHLNGEMPSTLQNCSLLSIDLGGNHLSGNLPSWMPFGSSFEVMMVRGATLSTIRLKYSCLTNLPSNNGNVIRAHYLKTLQGKNFGRNASTNM
ncbi:hypothetical protein CMV_024426 [Castanea mollissima]|uniref:Uncharacterized protein n=1 Tax=Castanea mollissima TaxID=60419 RepID=A0A8J4QI66_9ROSI|nr:hypothetical protein CMV_024426 [Castanea mollissima]